MAPVVATASPRGYIFVLSCRGPSTVCEVDLALGPVGIRPLCHLADATPWRSPVEDCEDADQSPAP